MKSQIEKQLYPELIVIALGSNIGDRLQNLRQANELIVSEFGPTSVSSVYETEAIEYLDQPSFLNMVVSCQISSKEIFSTFKKMQSIEKRMGRNKTIDKGPRNIDLDLIFFGNHEVVTPELTVPHISWMERNFVVFPLLDLPIESGLSSLIESFAVQLSSPSLFIKSDEF